MLRCRRCLAWVCPNFRKNPSILSRKCEKFRKFCFKLDLNEEFQAFSSQFCPYCLLGNGHQSMLLIQCGRNTCCRYVSVVFFLLSDECSSYFMRSVSLLACVCHPSFPFCSFFEPQCQWRWYCWFLSSVAVENHGGEEPIQMPQEKVWVTTVQLNMTLWSVVSILWA